MSDKLELREMTRDIRRLWWVPILLALVGVAGGVAAADNVPPVYRSQATVLVGPTDGAVTHSATIRTSENLALFYADMARRQIVLQPVVEELGLEKSWADLRNRVNSAVPTQNLRLVTVTVLGDDQRETDSIADALVSQLVSLSPAVPNSNDQAFVNEQVANLKEAIRGAQDEVTALERDLAAATDRAQRTDLRRKIAQLDRRIGDWQGTYVELIAVEPSSGAGGMQVIDHASAVTDMGRSGVAKQAAVGGAAGALFGIVISWLWQGRVSWRRAGRDRDEYRTAQDMPPASPDEATGHAVSDDTGLWPGSGATLWTNPLAGTGTNLLVGTGKGAVVGAEGTAPGAEASQRTGSDPIPLREPQAAPGKSAAGQPRRNKNRGRWP